MKKVILLSLVVGLSIFSNASEINAEQRFKQSCVVCHTDKLIDPAYKGNLVGPPADEVLTHIKEKFKDRDKAVNFMVDYIMKPDANKALCASMDKFGLMPSMKGVVTNDEAVEISKYMYNNFPHPEFAKKDAKLREGITFEKIDTNSDGYISPKEFREFRAKKNGIDVSKFKQDLYFKKVDINGDRKMDRGEFKRMQEEKMKK